MKLGVLFSGGKDSVLAMDRAACLHDIVCLITLESSNPDSFMFHTPCIELARKQAEALGLPHIVEKTEGCKESELEDMRRAVRRAVEEYGIGGLVTGAIASVYQASRVQRMCYDIGIKCFNPLWMVDQENVLQEILDKGYEAMIVGVSAYPLGEEFLGRIIDRATVTELLELGMKVGFNPAGEGGELETFVLHGPLFKKRLVPSSISKKYSNFSGRVLDMVLEVVD